MRRGLGDFIWSLLETCWDEDWNKRPRISAVVKGLRAYTSVKLDPNATADAANIILSTLAPQYEDQIDTSSSWVLNRKIDDSGLFMLDGNAGPSAEKRFNMIADMTK